MTSNYRNSLQWDLDARFQDLRRLEPAHAKAEAQYMATEHQVAAVTRDLQVAKRARDNAKENFRTVHKYFCNVKQEIGELQDELFRFGEEDEEWLH